VSPAAPHADGPTAADGPALGLLELTTIARGVVVADAALKRAPAVLVASRTLSGGKHLVVLAGGVAEVEEAMAAGRQAAGDRLHDRVELAYADAQVWPMLARAGVVVPADWADDAAAEALAIVETRTVCAAIAAADAACKAADGRGPGRPARRRPRRQGVLHDDRRPRRGRRGGGGGGGGGRRSAGRARADRPAGARAARPRVPLRP
jgi:microcompartment protein CcmL/EutN